jgi:hypothetical protein
LDEKWQDATESEPGTRIYANHERQNTGEPVDTKAILQACREILDLIMLILCRSAGLEP